MIKMTEQKQIEKMAKIIDDRLIEARGWLGSMNRGEGYWIAQKLVEHYQPKLPEDSVVLSKEEFSKALTDNFNMGKKEAQFYSERVAIPTTRKETAEKIYTFVNSLGTHNWERFEEFIKQFGVEIKK